VDDGLVDGGGSVHDVRVTSLGDITRTTTSGAAPSPAGVPPPATRARAGNLISQTDARSCTNTMQYDDLNRLTNKSYSGPDACGPDSSPAVNYYYDETDVTAFAVGRRTRMTDGSGSTKWTYDNRGRMLTEEKTINPPPGAGGEAQSFTTTWTYNRADLPLTMTYPSTSSGQAGEKLTYNYDSAGNLLSLSSNITNPRD
jgi:YD repeat-containing protein